MRILHIDTGREMRGGQRQVLMLMQALQASHQQVLLAEPRGALWETARKAELELVPVGLGEVWKRSRQADIVHAHDARSHTLAALASAPPFVVSRRVAFPVQRNPLSRWKYRRARRFLAVSQFVANELVRAQIPATKIDRVYDAVACDDMDAAIAKESGPCEQEFRVVALASRDERKGRDLVEQAASMTGIKVVYSDELLQDLPGASAFLYITRSEGFGSAALLAMSLSVPVIASRVGGLPEAVRDQQEGFLVNNDPEAIAGALQRLHADRDFARELGRNGRARVEQLFTRERMVEGTLASYASALCT